MPVGEVNAQKVTDFQAQIRALKNELVTLKDQLSKLRQESSKHQTRADQAAKEAAESAKTAKSAEEDFEKQKIGLRQVSLFDIIPSLYLLIGVKGRLSSRFPMNIFFAGNFQS